MNPAYLYGGGLAILALGTILWCAWVIRVAQRYRADAAEQLALAKRSRTSAERREELALALLTHLARVRRLYGFSLVEMPRKRGPGERE